MARVLVLYYSSYGHTEGMAQAVAEGARQGGASVDVRRIPETAPPDVVKNFNFKINHDIPVIQVPELESYDAIIFGVPVRFGRTPSQLGAFLDSAGSLWVRGALAGKIAAAFTSSSHAQAGQEATLIGMLITCLHLGMITVGVPWSDQGNIKAPNVGTACPYGSSTVVGFDNSIDVGVTELENARIQGKYVAEVAIRHFG